MPKQHQFDVLIIGSGAAGLMSAIQLSENFSIAVIVRNLVQTSKIIVESALSRKESRGLHFNQDYPKQLDKAHNSVIIKS